MYIYIYICVCVRVCTCNSIMICLMWIMPLVVYVLSTQKYEHRDTYSYICKCACSISPGCLTETFWRKPWLLHALVIRNMRQLPTKGENANISCYHHTSFSIHDLQWHSKCTYLRYIAPHWCLGAVAWAIVGPHFVGRLQLPHQSLDRNGRNGAIHWTRERYKITQ